MCVSVCVCVRSEDVGNGGDIDRDIYPAPDVADDARAALRRWWPDRHVVDMENVEMYTYRRFLKRQAPPTHTSLRRGRLGCARAATDGAAARSQTMMSVSSQTPTWLCADAEAGSHVLDVP